MITRPGLRFTLALLISSVAIATCARAAEKQDDAATGTWKWSFTLRDGQTREARINLTQAGEKLTGVYVGLNNQETPIEGGQIKDREVLFTITREFNDRKFTAKYKGKLIGNTLKGTIETNFDGRTRIRDWMAERESPPAEGTWTWSFARQDGAAIEFALKLHQDGEKLTGVSLINNEAEIAIEEGKVTGNAIAFLVTRERNGNRWTSHFQGQIDGDTIKGTITIKLGDRDRTFDWEAKRIKA